VATPCSLVAAEAASLRGSQHLNGARAA